MGGDVDDITSRQPIVLLVHDDQSVDIVEYRYGAGSKKGGVNRESIAVRVLIEHVIKYRKVYYISRQEVVYNHRRIIYGLG